MKNIIKIVLLSGISAILLIAYSGSANAASRFSILEEDIDTNTTGIATNRGDIDTNTSNILTNTSNISTNASISASGITINTGNILTNTGNISANAGISASGITTNAGNISANFDDISAQDIRITNNDMRITLLEGGGSGGGGGTGAPIAVVCTGENSDALKNTPLAPGNTYVLTGMCDGPISILEPAGKYYFKGDDQGTPGDDGIISQSDQTRFFVFGISGPVSVQMDNLTISAENFTSQSDGVYVTAIYVAGNASLGLYKVNVVGGDSGVAADGGYISFDGDASSGDSSVMGFREDGLSAFNGGSIVVRSPITVMGATTWLGGSFSEALAAFRNGVIQIGQGGSFIAATNGESTPFERFAAAAGDNSTIRINNSGTVTLTGDIWAKRSSVIRIQTGAITGAIDVSYQSHVSVENVDHSGGNIDIIHGSGFKVVGSNLIGGSDDSIFVAGASTMVLDHTIMGTGSASIEVLHYGVLKFDDGNDLNGRNVLCVNPEQSIAIEGGRGNIGIGEGSCFNPPPAE